MNPVQAFISTYNSAQGNVQSTFITFSFAITQEFEAYAMLKIMTPATYSAGGEIYTWRSNNGGLSYETDGTFKGAFPATVSSTHTKTINLETGQYLVGVMVGGGGANLTISCEMLTAYAITAYV